MKTFDRRRPIKGLVALSFAATLVATSASAQLTVYDPINYSQNVLTAARELQSVNNQITQLQHETTSLLNQTKNLTALPTSILSQLQQNITRTQALVSQAQNIAYDVTKINQAFSSTYGTGSLTATDTQLVTNAQTRWQFSVAGLQDSMRTQATVLGNSNNYQTQASGLVTASQGASGALAATQAGNQLLAIQSQQLNDLTALLAAQARAQDLKAAEDATAAAQGAEQRKRFIQLRNDYTPGTAQMFY
jgi:P-type conjugative transfer protein TrbJ